VWNLSGTELEVPVAWDRTARIDTIEATGGPGPTVNWTVGGGSTILRMRYNQDAGTLKYCGEFGDRMLALTDADDILRITTGSLDGVPVLSEATIENGVYTPPAVPVPGLATWGLLLGAAALALAGRTRLRRR
jgi:hypothetical protein